MTEPLRPDAITIEDIRDWHQPLPSQPDGELTCDWCRQPWPCLTDTALREADRWREDSERLAEVIRIAIASLTRDRPDSDPFAISVATREVLRHALTLHDTMDEQP